MNILQLQQNIIKKLFRDDVTPEELDDLHRNGDIDLVIMMRNEIKEAGC